MNREIFRIAPIRTAEEAEQWEQNLTVEQAQDIGIDLEEPSDVICYACRFGIRGDDFGAFAEVTAYYDALGGYFLDSIKWLGVMDGESYKFQDAATCHLLEELLEGMIIRADDTEESPEIFRSKADEAKGTYSYTTYSLDTMQAVED